MSMFWDEEAMVWCVMWRNTIIARFTLESLATAFVAANGY